MKKLLTLSLSVLLLTGQQMSGMNFDQDKYKQDLSKRDTPSIYDQGREWSKQDKLRVGEINTSLIELTELYRELTLTTNKSTLLERIKKIEGVKIKFEVRIETSENSLAGYIQRLSMVDRLTLQLPENATLLQPIATTFKQLQILTNLSPYLLTEYPNLADIAHQIEDTLNHRDPQYEHLAS